MASYYVNKSGKSGWRVIEQSYEDEKSIQRTVPKESYPVLGFNPDWTIQEAKQRVKQLNKANHDKRKETHSHERSATRLKEITENSSLYAPVELCMEFIEHLKTTSFGTARHREHLVSHFRYVQTLVKKLKLEAHEFNHNKEKIYLYFQDDEISLDYTNKILRVMNLWAKFVCRKRNQYFEEIPAPRGPARSAIEESYQDSETFIGESEPLTPEMLHKKQNSFPVEKLNWLKISIWLGLRPGEVDGLRNEKNYRMSEERGVKILSVYMPKLTGLTKDKRWKHIPLLFPEQIELLEVIKSKVFHRPLTRVLKTYFPGVTLYGGRKNFIDLMLDKNQKLEDISSWLGHQSIETTWRKYRNKKRVSWSA